MNNAIPEVEIFITPEQVVKIETWVTKIFFIFSFTILQLIG